ncbi:hypothetical protein TNCV_4288101 [Trichonephila clavipes]|uniref:Uncharacterized protein n=1 Tax=Trichonephila clavipes TaxID=2585209 RepID=A0A8X6S6T1_TRICX|nr:hypothetical protein TNCV_4288101 [Trichonephila clavipes]
MLKVIHYHTNKLTEYVGDTRMTWNRIGLIAGLQMPYFQALGQRSREKNNNTLICITPMYELWRNLIVRSHAQLNRASRSLFGLAFLKSTTLVTTQPSVHSFG